MNYYALFAGTFFILLISWFLSVKHKRYHGIARFFAFESILILFLLNYRVWFNDPFSFSQLISWTLLMASAYIATTGYLLLKRKGNPDTNFENTSVLVKTGIYKYIRHPLYLSLFCLGTGIMMKNPQLVQIILGTVNLISVWITSRMEEKEMIAKFGKGYTIYIKETKMFIPFIL